MKSHESEQEVALKRVGETLCNKWHLDHLIDIGGMAAVYAATHRNGKRVAVKVLHKQFSQAATHRKRFLREGFLANKVEHADAVCVLDDDETPDGCVFLVMELLEGESLEGRLAKTGGVLGPNQVLAIADQVLDVLRAAHLADVIHRDIKPANLFLTREGRVKVLDFGLARFLQTDPKAALTARGVVMGTSAYMAPEQARAAHDQIDARTDLFSLGAVMFRALAGRFVHQGETPTDRLIAAMTVQAPSLASVMPTIPKAVGQVVDKSMAFKKEDRWPSAEAMQTAVRMAFAALSRLPAAPSDSIDVTFVDTPTISDPNKSFEVELSMSDVQVLETGGGLENLQLGLEDMIDVPPDRLNKLAEMSGSFILDIVLEEIGEEAKK